MGEIGEVRRGCGGVRAVRVKAAVVRWTAAKQRDFLVALAGTANVSLSARTVGMSEQGAYALRRRDEGFRRAWAEALSEGFDRLELMLLERAMTGTPKEHLSREGAVLTTIEFSERLALNLLSQHRAAVLRARQEQERLSADRAQVAAIVTIDADGVRADLIAKLELMGLRLGGGDVPASDA